MNFRFAFEKEHGVSFFAAQLVDIDEDIASIVSLTSNGPQTYQRCICDAKKLHKRPYFLHIAQNVLGKKTRARTLEIAHCDNETLFSSWVVEEPFKVRIRSKYVKNSTKHHPFHAPFFCKSENYLSHKFHSLYWERETISSLSFLHSSARTLLQTRIRQRLWNESLLILFSSIRKPLR